MASLAVPLIGMGLSALGGLFGNRSQTATKTTTSDIDQTQANHVNYDPLMQAYRDQMLGAWQQRMRQPVNSLVDSYVANGANNINAGAGALRKNAASRAAASGGGYSPNASAGAIDQGRVGSLVQLYNSAPQIAQQMQLANLQGGSQFLSSLPYDTTSNTTGHNTSTEKATAPGNMLGGLFGGAGASLGAMYGMGAFGGPKPFQGTTSVNSGYPQYPMG